MLARGLDPLGPTKPRAEGRSLGIFWHTQSLSQILHGSVFFGKKVFLSASPLNCSWRIRNSYVFLDKAPFSVETRGLTGFLPVCQPSQPHKVFRFLPLTNRRGGTGRAARQSSVL